MRVIDVLARVLPPNVVFPPLMELVELGMQSADANARKSALTALGVSVEGCSEHMRPLMADIWPYFDRGFADSSPIVRKAVCIAFACMCEWLNEECIARHEVLVGVCLSDSDSCVGVIFIKILFITVEPFEPPKRSYFR